MSDKLFGLSAGTVSRFFLTLAQSCMPVKLLKVCCMVLVPICCSLQMVACWVDYWFDMCCSSQEWWEMNMTMSCRGWLWRNWLYVYSYIYNTYVYIYMYLVLHDIDLFDTCRWYMYMFHWKRNSDKWREPFNIPCLNVFETISLARQSKQNQIQTEAERVEGWMDGLMDRWTDAQWCG